MNSDVASAVEVIQNQSKVPSPISINGSEGAIPSADLSSGLPTDGVTQEGEAPKPEDPLKPEKKPEQEKQAEMLSKRFANLSLKEREIQRSQAQLKREREEFLKLKEQGEAKPKNFDSPLELLESHGWSYDDVTQFVLSGSKPEKKKARELEEKLEKLTRERQEEKEAQAKREKEQEESKKIQEFKAGLKTQLLQEPERFELIQQNDGFDLVYDTMLKWFEQNGESPDALKIADLVETYYENELKGQITKLKSTKKLGSLFQVEQKQAQSEKEPEAKSEAESVLGIKTLTNAQSQTATKSANRTLSDDELIAEAAKLMSSR